jgi:hypothetical protein
MPLYEIDSTLVAICRTKLKEYFPALMVPYLRGAVPFYVLLLGASVPSFQVPPLPGLVSNDFRFPLSYP